MQTKETDLTEHLLKMLTQLQRSLLTGYSAILTFAQMPNQSSLPFQLTGLGQPSLMPQSFKVQLTVPMSDFPFIHLSGDLESVERDLTLYALELVEKHKLRNILVLFTPLLGFKTAGDAAPNANPYGVSSNVKIIGY